MNNNVSRVSYLPMVAALVAAAVGEGSIVRRSPERSSKPLWHVQTGGALYAGPMAFAIDRQEYIAIAAGIAIYTLGLP